MTDNSTRKIEIVYRKVEDLTPYERNSRSHSDKQIRKLAQAIQKFGFASPIVLDGKNGILAGHGRLASARFLGMTDVPTIDLGHLTRDEQRAYIISDNALQDMSSWDEEILASELRALQDVNFDLSLTALDQNEIADLLAPVEIPTEEPKPTPAPPTSQPGDVWLLGDHRLEVHSGEMAVVDALLGLWHSHMDSPARLEATGQSFAEAMAERNPDAPITTKVKKAKGAGKGSGKAKKESDGGNEPSATRH